MKSLALSVAAVALAALGSQLLPPGPAPAAAFAWLVHWSLMAAAEFALPGRLPDAAGPLRFTVSGHHGALYRRLGVGHFGRLLERTGWNTLVRSARGYGGGRGGLPQLAEQTWRSELGHVWALLTALALSAVLLCLHMPETALWLVALAAPLHLYPALLQRHIRARIQRLNVQRA
ncbi:hypothetical protein GCM10017783_00760 [Deinococcus piscis]|uniref:Glycosyl-4,4'-diaponeurosporenoate acyltransferase n=1 Tax=Deinococcus piscis TaxID=394230 RepID=A0ABQ3JW88_9DEIO|nr:hypothetical protein GCM10017783_00760 [Deinococcus piscis]